MISTRSAGLVIDTVVCLTLVKWETVSGRFGGYLTGPTLTSTLGSVPRGQPAALLFGCVMGLEELVPHPLGSIGNIAGGHFVAEYLDVNVAAGHCFEFFNPQFVGLGQFTINVGVHLILHPSLASDHRWCEATLAQHSSHRCEQVHWLHPNRHFRDGHHSCSAASTTIQDQAQTAARSASVQQSSGIDPSSEGGKQEETMLRMFAVAGFLAFATSAQAITPAPIPQPDGMITQ
jgi:hypothetical protein